MMTVRLDGSQSVLRIKQRLGLKTRPDDNTDLSLAYPIHFQNLILLSVQQRQWVLQGFDRVVSGDTECAASSKDSR